MKRQTFNELIENRRFRELFISEMGWNNINGQVQLVPYIFDDVEMQITAIAERNGFQVLQCEVDEIPTSSICKKLDLRLRYQAERYILIFYQPRGLHHLWVAPVKKTEKRDLVFVEYETLGQADFLFSKIDGLGFGLDEHTTIVDVKERIQSAFVVNSERLTKDFYQGFRKQHTAFVKFILGIDDEIADKNNRNKQWYASIMLNRLMFCYFIQKKGFLDNNTNYLREKLAWVRREQGENRFFQSFYRGFLSRLFHGGLNAPHHSEEFEDMYGRIPYLNGGMFDRHQLEQQYEGIDIADEAFENLFAFFDKWHWHLDDRHTASGHDINPDVLGYIFEQYINDRAAMGAYYTKEDITEYIGKNCILPFLMDKVRTATKESGKSFRPNGYVWQWLKQSGDRYVYDAVKHGYTSDWQERIPDYIAQGIDTSKPNLLERRSRWNERTSEEFALPTEIWRETVDRLQRCGHLLEKIAAGGITETNDLVTYNLNVRQFVYDLLLYADDHRFVAHFYHALQHVTILDPTCGSGAFLFAAMNILEPLYEVCIERMEQWHDENAHLFKDELEKIDRKYRSNRQYFIYKSIILRNLYGVDIMVEATEIAKLRLFLKMVAVVEVDMRADNLGLDPLPDIDFNIRCGNTLVGYATEKELERDLIEGDMFANMEFKEKVECEMKKSALAYEQFKSVQFHQEEDMTAFKDAKKQLKSRLETLNEILDKRLYKASRTSFPFEKWKKSHQPFHWLSEYYEIIQGKGGFDVIIGNPPYVEHSSNDVNYSLEHLVSESCGNLYGNCIERGLQIGSKTGKFSFIVPIAITCSKRMDMVIRLLKEKSGLLLFANFDDRPGKLFEMIEHLRATIFIADRKQTESATAIFGTKYNRWYSEHRNLLFQQLCFANVTRFSSNYTIPKFSTELECSINDKILNNKFVIAYTYGLAPKENKVYYRAAGGGYFLLMKIQKSITYIDGVLENVKAEKAISISSDYKNSCIGSVLSSSLFYWNYIGYTDCRNLTKSFIDTFPIPQASASDANLSEEGNALFANYERTKYTKNTTYKTTGRNVVYDEYYPKLSKKYIDEIDKVLAKHYGFTDEELDFIINYDIKYRMGEELNGE